MKLSAWAKQQGISYKTAWRMWKAGTLPVSSEQLSTGTVVLHLPEAEKYLGVALYARVSGSDQKADLERQLSRLGEFAVAQNYAVVAQIKEIGSGLNGHRPALLRLLHNRAVSIIVVEHRERLTRFGFEYVEAALAATGRRLVCNGSG